MRTFKEFKNSIAESADAYAGLQDADIEFEIDNVDVDDVLDTEADTFMIDEDAVDTIKSIVKDKQMKTVKFQDKKSAKVDMQTANILLKVMDALNDKNKEKFAGLMSKSKKDFMKAVDFAMASIK